MDDLERELDADISSRKSIFKGTGVPGRPSNLNMFGKEVKVSINDMLKEQDQVELLVTESQVLHERARRKELEAMEKGLK